MNTLLRTLFAAGLTSLLALAACGNSVCDKCGSGGSGGGEPCASTTGLLTGHVSYSPDFTNSPAANALIALRKTPTDTPLYAMADATGAYSVPIEAGEWYVSAEDSTGCFTDMPQTVTIDACGEVKLDLVLDICTG